MSREIFEIIAYLSVIAILAWPLGRYMERVLRSAPPSFTRPLRGLEASVYKLAGIDPSKEMSWQQYTAALLIFNGIGLVFLFAIQVLQQHLPLNPAHQQNISIALAFNTAVSFVTNTNWQAYSGEAAMSYLTQMLGLGVQNFLSAATGIAVAAALARSLAQKSTKSIGNFWADMTRAVVYILLPLSLILAVLLVSQGVIQNFSAYQHVVTVDGGAVQQLPMGPAASQVAIKQLGSNGGGFFGVNSSHPFENPTPLSNFLEMLALLLIPAALPITFGRLVGNRRHGIAIFVTMSLLLLSGLSVALFAEFSANPALENLPFMEGKEVRFGIASSTLWAVATTTSSNGSVNAMMSSLSPLSGLVAMTNMMLGEVIFGGVGSGLYGMVLFVILAVFIAGLMVGRTPEYLGKKIEAKEIKIAVLGVLAPSLTILILSAIACSTAAGLSSLASKGPHGLSEILYAFSSAAGNNGSAFAGLNANTPFYNNLLSLAMLIGRYAVIVPVLALAGSLAAKKKVPPSLGTFPVEGGAFVLLLAATILIIGALTFFPALSLGPIVEHFIMTSGSTF